MFSSFVLLAAAPVGISLSPQIVTAAKRKLSAFTYSAISTEFPIENGKSYSMSVAKRVRSENKIAAIGAVPYAANSET